MTAETSNYVRVAPSPANGNGSGSGSASDEPNAQPRAGARTRGAESVSKVLAVTRQRRGQRAAPALPSGESDRPDMWRRSPLPLSVVWDRARADAATRWSSDDRVDQAIAGLLLAYAVFAIAVSGAAYLLAFSAQTWPRAVWLIVAVAALAAFLFAGGEPAPSAPAP